jgi:hypothetical protein
VTNSDATSNANKIKRVSAGDIIVDVVVVVIDDDDDGDDVDDELLGVVDKEEVADASIVRSNDITSFIVVFPNTLHTTH